MSRSRWPGTAVFDKTGQYRYLLTRERDLMLGESRRRIGYCMLNPSKAGATDDDPTIVKLYGYTDRLGANAFDVVNLHAYIATDPLALGRCLPSVAIGPENDEYIEAMLGRVERLIAGWGGRGNLYRREDWFRSVLASRGIQTWALKLTKEGSPCHPGRLPYAVKMVPWPAPQEARP